MDKIKSMGCISCKYGEILSIIRDANEKQVFFRIYQSKNILLKRIRDVLVNKVKRKEKKTKQNKNKTN